MGFYKLIKAMEHSINSVKLKKPEISGLTWFQQWHGVNGSITKKGNDEIARYQENIGENVIVNPILTFSEAKEIAIKIDKLNVGSEHTEVKNNNVWRAAYQYADRGMKFMNNLGNIEKYYIETIPCHNCGIILSFDTMQVDHQMPQAGSEDLYTLKTLRAFGMTESGPTGSKGNVVMAGNKINSIDIFPKNRRIAGYKHLRDSTPGDKWSTNIKGRAFLSLIAYGGSDCRETLAKVCKNSLLNLTPLCPECNREKSDTVRPIV
jgi:hypothetical protein